MGTQLVLIPRILISCVMAAILSGCGSIRYQVADNVPKARLRLVTTAFGIVSAYAYSDEDCRTGIALLAALSPLSIQSSEMLGMPSVPDLNHGAMRETYIAANSPFISSMFFHRGNVTSGSQTCFVTSKFNPTAGKDYEMVYSNVGSDESSGCQVKLYDITQTDGVPQHVELPLERSKFQCQFENVRDRALERAHS